MYHRVPVQLLLHTAGRRRSVFGIARLGLSSAGPPPLASPRFFASLNNAVERGHAFAGRRIALGSVPAGFGNALFLVLRVQCAGAAAVFVPGASTQHEVRCRGRRRGCCRGWCRDWPRGWCRGCCRGWCRGCCRGWCRDWPWSRGWRRDCCRG
jgi:hypothetical protein